MIRDEHLVKVMSESELRAGMTVVIKPCENCNSGSHFAVLTKKVETGTCDYCLRDDDAFEAIEPIDHDVTMINCWGCAIDEGVLYRLRDDIVGKEDSESVDVTTNRKNATRATV